MLGLSALYFAYGNIAWVKSVSRGLGVVVIALLLQAVWHLGRNVKRHWLDVVIALLALLALWLRVNYILVFVVAGLLRMLLSLKLLADQVSPREPGPAPGLPAGTILTHLALTLLGLAVLVGGSWLLDPKLGLMVSTFFKIALVAFGGGYAMIPILQWDLVDHLGWLDSPAVPGRHPPGVPHPWTHSHHRHFRGVLGEGAAGGNRRHPGDFFASHPDHYLPDAVLPAR